MNKGSQSHSTKKPALNLLKDNLGLIINIVNTQIGVGIVTLPQSFRMGGFFFSLICAFICILLIFYTSRLMIKSSLLAPDVRTYGELCRAAHGKWFRVYASAMMCLLTFGYTAVFSITMRKQLEDVIADITGKTFKHGKVALLGIMVPVGLVSMPKTVRKLTFPSLFSAICVLVMIVVSFARGRFYHNELTGMTREKIVLNEQSLDIDRAMWACDTISPKKTDFELSGWPSVDVTNFNVLEDSLEASNACGLNRLSWGAVSEAIASITVAPAASNPVENVASWEEVLRYEHSRHLFNEFSLNAEGAERNNFTLFSFINDKFLVTLGTLASTFIYQQASIVNFQQLKNRSVRDYNIVVSISFVIFFSFCMMIACAGYFSQQYQVGTYIFTKMKLRYYRPGELDYAVITARFALIISICLTYPMQFFFSRLNLMIVVTIVRNWIRGENLDPQRPGNALLYVCTAILWAATVLIGLFFEKAGILFSFVGALLGGQMIYILPIICWMSLNGGFARVAADTKRKGIPKFLLKFVFPVTVLVFGVVNVISSTIVTALNLVD